MMIPLTHATGSLRHLYCAAATFETFLNGVEANRELWHAVARRAVVSDTIAARAKSLTDRWHLLVLAEDWCGDAVNTVPAIAELARIAPNLHLRVVGREANADIMDTHLTGQSRSIPVVMLLDADFVERAWWGPRPSALPEWVGSDAQVLSKEDRYREVRRWYARDRGVTAMTDVLDMIARVRAERVAA